MSSKFWPEKFVSDLCERLLPPNIKVEVESCRDPGGDPENIAHVRSLPILNDFLIEYDDTTEDENVLRLALLHEVLHIVFRHVSAAITVVKETEPIIAAMFDQALEEDIEAMARTQVDLMVGLGRREVRLPTISSGDPPPVVTRAKAIEMIEKDIPDDGITESEIEDLRAVAKRTLGI